MATSSLYVCFFHCYQSDEEPPELEDISEGSHSENENESEKEDTSTSPSGDHVFITEVQGTSVDAVLPDDGGCDTVEEIPLITPSQGAAISQDGLFSKTATADHAPPNQALIIGVAPTVDKSKERFRPLIEEVISEDFEQHRGDNDNIDHDTTNSKTRPHTTKSVTLAAAPPTSHAHQSPPEETVLEAGGQWACIGDTAKLRPSTPPISKPLADGLLIEEIEEDDFNIGQLPLTSAEQAAIAEADAMLKRVKDCSLNELSQEERVWQLAASAGSTLEEEKGVELDEMTKARVRERLDKHGLIDKTSLKF